MPALRGPLVRHLLREQARAVCHPALGLEARQRAVLEVEMRYRGQCFEVHGTTQRLSTPLHDVP
jgi:hypothetical protein